MYMLNANNSGSIERPSRGLMERIQGRWGVVYHAAARAERSLETEKPHLGLGAVVSLESYQAVPEARTATLAAIPETAPVAASTSFSPATVEQTGSAAISESAANQQAMADAARADLDRIHSQVGGQQ